MPSLDDSVHWMILTPDAKTLFFLVGPSEGSDPENALMRFDREKRTVERAFLQKDGPRLYRSPFPAWSGERTLLVNARSARARTGGRMEYGPCILDVRSGELEKVQTQSGWCCFSACGRYMFTYGIDESFRLFDRKTMSFVARVPDSRLPGNGGFPVSLVGSKHVLVWRERTPKMPLGTYLLNMKTGKYAKVSCGYMPGVTYLGKCIADLEWKKGLVTKPPR
jgi:hypothetical protein